MKHSLKQAWVACLWLPVLFSCATYNNKLAGYYNSIGQSDYYRANALLSQNGFLQQDRNRLLFFLEKGKIYHVLGSYDSSNLYFNLADNFIENKRKSAADFIKGNLLNPMTQTYLGEDYEKFLIHYYKALNYLYKGEKEEAVVEARRITLATNAQQEKFTPNKNRYTEDAFALLMQGLVYETAGETNNAFISYRKAVDLFLSKPEGYYGVAMPNQLKKDLLRTADKMGFADQVELYQRKIQLEYSRTDEGEGGELVVFFERGMAPAKTEQNFILAQDGNGNGTFLFSSQYGSFNVPFDFSAANVSNTNSINRFRTIRVAVPAYIPQPYTMSAGTATVNNQTYKAELAEDINTLAPLLLKERILKEVSSALVRQVVKKLAEVGASAASKEVAKNNSKEKNEKKKKDNAELVGLTAGLLVNLFNTATEKADTRNWQSLPAFIQYVRFPLKKGENIITLKQGRNSKTLTIKSTGGLQMFNWVTVK